MPEKITRAARPEEWELPIRYIEKVRTLMESRPVPPMAMVVTYGCQQNEADSDRIRGMLSEMGYAFTQDPEQADFIAYNTCAVREHAELRVLGRVGALKPLKEKKSSLVIALCGCMMQQEHRKEEIRGKYRHVDLVVGTHALHRLPQMLHGVLTGGGRAFETGGEDGIAEGLPVLREGGSKAWVTVMTGCNNFCTYCVVPYLRGRESSRRPGDILREVETLASEGCRDITLLGQNVNSYGKDLPDGVDFADLLTRINAVPGDFLIRFMTSHPKDATEKLLDAMAACEKVAPHLHLPVQCGSDRILRAMNRGYTTSHYRELAAYARKKMPDLTLTSDIIVGFPGETQADFEDTLGIVKEIGFDSLYTFIYSKRSGTPAAEMEEQLPYEEKVARLNRLMELQSGVSQEKNEALVGRVLRVLAEGVSSKDETRLSGRTPGGKLVHFSGPSSLAGEYVKLRITGATPFVLEGELPEPLD